MKKQFLRVLSILLSLTLFLGIVPTAALTVLAEAVGDALTPENSEAVVSDVTNIEVTPDNMAWEIVYTGEGEDPLWMLSHEFVNSWTDEEKAAASWEIIPGVYDDDWNFVEVTSGHFEYLWFYGIGYDSWIENIAPIGKTSGWWKPKVQKYWEENPDDMECIGLVETMDGWTSDPSVPMLNTFGELTGLSGDYYVPYTLMAFIRYVPDEGEAVMSYGAQQLNMIEFPDGADYIPESIHTKPVNWKYSTAIQNHTVKAAIGQPYTPAVYQNYFIARDVGYTMGAGSLCGGAYGASCYCYMMGWMTLRDGVEVDDFTGDPSQFIPIGMDDATWEDLLVEYADDHEALYEYLCWGPGDFTNNNSVPLYMTENLATGSTDYYSNSSNLADYSEYTIVPVVRLETGEIILNDNGEEEWITNMLYTVGEPITIVPVEPGLDAPDDVDSEVPVFKEASPLPKDIIIGIDPLQIEGKLVCDASYGERLITYQWYFSETPDYNGVPVNNGSGHEQSKEFYPEPPNATELDKAFYYYCEYSFVNINGITETYYTTITKVRRIGALAIDVTVTPGEIYMQEMPNNTDKFKSYYTRFNNNNLDLWNEDFTIPYAYQSKGSDSVLSAWIEPTVGYGKFKYSDYITYQWFKSDTADYTTGTPVGDEVTIRGLGDFANTRTSVNGLRTYSDFNEVNQYANIHIDCPTDEVGEFYMTVVLKNYYADVDGVQHVYETYSTCRVTTFEKNEDLYHVTKDGTLDAYNGHENVMTIPDEVNGIKVTSLYRLGSSSVSMNADKDIHHMAGARKIILPEGLTTVSYGAFFRLYTLEEIVFSSTITTIESLAFADTGHMENLVIPAHITTIENSAFRKSRIKQLTFNENVWPDFGNAFYDSLYLHTVILPANVTGDIGGAFYGCLQLIRVENYENITYVRDDPNFNLVFTSDFFGCPASEYIEDNVGGCDGNFTYILNEDGASWCITEAWGDYLEHVTFPATYKGLPVTVLGRGTGTWGQSNMLNAHLVKWPEYLKSVTIPDSITTINDYAFENCENLETVNFHRNISYVGVDAFKFCYRLSSDVVLASGASVESEAFAFCSNIKKMDAPGARLRAKSFNNCFSLESITSYEPWLPPADYEDGSYKNPYTYSNFLYSNLYTDYSECYLKYWSVTGEPEVGKSSLRRSGDIIYQIVNNKAVPYYYADVDAMEIIVPASLDGYKVTTVDGGFLYWMLSTGYSIEFEEGITTLQSKETFSEHNIGRVILPNSMVDISDFFAESLLEEVHIPANVINFSFTDCELLHTVTFAEGSKLSEISAQAFYGCTALKTVEFEKLTALETICRSAFNGTGLETVDLTANTNLKTIEQAAFYHTPLKAVRLPESLETIEENAFAADEWEGDGAYYVATLDPMTELVLPEGLKYIGAYAFYGRFMDNAENAPFLLDLPDSVETLCNDAFGGYYVPAYNGELLVNNIQLAEEKLPASLKVFGGGAAHFAPFSYSQIDTLVFQPNIEELLSTLEMRSLNKIVFEGEPRTGSKLRVLGALFDDSSENCEIVGWDNLQKLEIIEGVSFGGWKYDKEEYTLPSSLIRLNSFGGWDSTAFDTIIIPDGVQYVGSVPCVSTPENPRKIIAYGTSASAPELHDYWLQYNHSLIASQGYQLAPLYCYTGSAYHEWAVEHDYPYVLMDDGTNTITLKFYDSVLNKRQMATNYFKSIVWKDKNGNVVGDKDLLSNVTVGEEYSYEVSFYNDKSWQYKLPFTSGTVTAIEGGASVNLTISPLENMTLTGKFSNHAEPGFIVQVQSRASAKGSWYTVSTLTMTDLGEDGSFSLQMPVKDVRLVMSVTGVTKFTQTEKIYLARSGRLENGVMDLGEVKMDYKGAEPDIRVNGDLSNVPNLYIETENGTSYAVSGSKGYLYIRDAINAGVKAGDTVTLRCAYGDSTVSGYDITYDPRLGSEYIEPFTFTVPYNDDGTILDVEVKKAARVIFTSANRTGTAHIYDEQGNLVKVLQDGLWCYVLPGKYTAIAMERRDPINTFAEFKQLDLPEDAYVQEEFTVDANDYKGIACAVPRTYYNSGTVTVSALADVSQYDPYTGLVPVNVQYKDAEAVAGEYTIRVRYSSTNGDAEKEYCMIDGKYAFGNNVVSATVEQTFYEDAVYSNDLLVTLDASQSIFCFYVPADGTGYTISVDVPEIGSEQVEKFVTVCSCVMPTYQFSVSTPPEVTDQDHGEVTVSAYSHFTYKAVVYVDDTEKEYVCTGDQRLPYSFKTYEDGASEHTLVVAIYSLSDQLLWTSKEYVIRHDRKYNEMSQPQKLDVAYVVDPQNAGAKVSRGAIYFTTGVQNMPHLTVSSPNELNGFMISSPVELRYSLLMSNPGQVIGDSVTLVVYFCKASPYTMDVNLAFNPATGTFDGKLEWEANTFSIMEMPYGFDIQYTCESPKSKISPTFRQEQAEASLAEREALMAMVGKQYTSFDLEQLQKDFDADETLTPTQREELMDYAAWLNEGIQLLNSMSGSSSTADFQTSLAEVQKIWTDLMANMEIISLADDPPTAQELLDEGYTYCEFNGMPMYGFSSDVSTTIVYLDELAPENSFMLMVFGEMSTFSSEGDDDSIVDDMFKQLMAWINTGLGVADEMMQDAINYVEEFKQWLEKYDKVATGDNYYWNEFESALEKNPNSDSYKEAVASKEQLQAMQKELKQNGLDKRLDELHDGIKSFRKMLSANNYKEAAATAKTLKAIAKPAAIATKTLPGGIGTAIGIGLVVLDAGMVAVDAYETKVWVDEQQARIQNYYDDYWNHCLKDDCYDQKKAQKLLDDSEDAETWFWIGASACYVARVATMVGDAIASVSSSVNVLAGTAIGAGTTVISMIFDTSLEEIKDNTEKDYTNIYRDMIRALPPRCFTECPTVKPPVNPPKKNPPKEPDNEPPAPGVVIDPSGYVYEAVASNRIEGATAKVYYLDENGNEVYWEDAAAYDEVNPQITDVNGKYGWMVPVGKWKVRVTKDGYYDADSTKDPAADENGWLPVPPPQTAVHIGMVSKAAPVIDSVHVAEDKMQVIFSQYMDIAHLMSSDYLLRVFADGAQVPVKLEFADAEVSPTKEGVYYGRILNITRTDGQQFVGEDITLVVNGDVRNYAGTAMGTDYNSGKMSVGQVADALSHSYPNRLVMAILENVDVALQVVDTQGKPMAGVEVTMKTAVGDFLTVNNTTAVSDENGRVVFAVSGRAAGTEFLTFTTANGITAEMEVRVDTTTVATLNKPTANLSDYSVVDCGTQLIISTNVENGIIYYTTNDTCPCTESENRQIYTGPIDLTESAFYRIAVWTEEDGYSERLNLHLTVKHDYAEDGVTCNRCGSSEGDDPIVEDIITFDGYSVSEDVNGLAFRFTIDVTGMTQKGTTAVYDNAKVMYNGQEYSLVGMGAIVSNDADAELTRENIDGVQTIDVFAKYLWNLNEDSASYAVRVIDIPEEGKDTTVYARAYFVIEVEGEQVVVYADDVAEQTYNGVLNG